MFAVRKFVAGGQWPMLAVIGLTLSGCASTGRTAATIDSIQSEIDAAVASQPTTAPVPAEVSAALLPGLGVLDDMTAKPDAGERFDISVSDVPAAQFFMGLVDGTDFNMVVHPEVTGNISLNLKNVTIPMVMKTVRDVYGYEYEVAGHGFQVLPARMQARIFYINYLNVDRTGSSQTLVSSGSLTRPSGSSNGSGEDSGSGNSNNNDSSSGSAAYGTAIRTEHTRSQFWRELQGSITAIIGTGGNRSVVANPQSGVVVVRALPSELREVEVFLQTTQAVIQRQVILEAKILEVTLNDGFQSGINWGALSRAGSNRFLSANQVGGGSIFKSNDGTTSVSGNSGSTDPRLFTTSGAIFDSAELLGGATTAFGGVFSLALRSNDFYGFIELLKTQGSVRVLSSPRISTTNNQKAVIKVGTDEFFITDFDTNTSNSNNTTTNSNTNTDITLTPFFSGIALDVTPQISATGDVTLHVHPSVSDVVDDAKVITLNGRELTLPLALSTVRETDSIVRARDGQVVVIGGLMQEKSIDRDAGVPGLSDIPGIGGAFKHQQNSTVKSELVILLRPVVIRASEDWASDLRRSSDRLDSFRQVTQ